MPLSLDPPSSSLDAVLEEATETGVQTAAGEVPRAVAALRDDAGPWPAPGMAVMVARGDMTIEIGYEQVSEVPHHILELCEAAHIPCIWATLMRRHVALSEPPTRGGPASAALQPAECVLLGKGPHAVPTIAILDDILTQRDVVPRRSRTLTRHMHSWN